MHIRVLDRGDELSWKEFTASMGSPHHVFSWGWWLLFSRIARTTPYYLGVFDGNHDSKLVGVMPLVYSKRSFQPGSLISIPFVKAGGTLAINQNYHKALINFSCQLNTELNAQEYLIKNKILRDIPSTPDLPIECRPTTIHRLELDSSSEDLFNKFPPKLRSLIRRPPKHGFFPTSYSGFSPQTKPFQVFSDLYSETPGDSLGYLPSGFFLTLKKFFGSRLHLVLIWSQRTPIAGAILLSSKYSAEIPWIAVSNRNYNAHSLILVYWELAKIAQSLGCSFVDFATSSEHPDSKLFLQLAGAKPVSWPWILQTTAPPGLTSGAEALYPGGRESIPSQCFSDLNQRSES